MKTNAAGFVLLQKPAALNLHGSSHTLPQVPVEAVQVRVQTKRALFMLRNVKIIGLCQVHHKVPCTKCVSAWKHQAADARLYN